MRQLLAISLLLICGLSPFSMGQDVSNGVRQWRPTFFMANGPEYNQVQITVELPPSRHMENKEGTDGYGLCVPTSVSMAADYQNLPEWRGFRDWWTAYPGGAGPNKLDSFIAEYASQRGLKVPDYIQHVGGDEQLLRSVLSSGRYPCVTYGGMDNVFYSEFIAHMVNCVYEDDNVACIQDNNHPGQYLWMDRDSFLARWRLNGGWMFVWLAPPPPPVPINTRVAHRSDPVSTDEKGMGVVKPKELYVWRYRDDDWASCAYLYRGIRSETATKGTTLTWVQVGGWSIKRGRYRAYDEATRTWAETESDKTPFPFESRLNPVDPNATPKNYGLFPLRRSGQSQEQTATWAFINGKRVSNAAFTSDAAQSHLTAVGNLEFRQKFRQSVGTLGGVLVQDYDPDNWAVKDINFPSGITAQAPTKGGKGVVLWRSELPMTGEELREQLRRSDPLYDPKMDTQPDKPRLPDPNPLVRPVVPALPSPKPKADLPIKPPVEPAKPRSTENDPEPVSMPHILTDGPKTTTPGPVLAVKPDVSRHCWGWFVAAGIAFWSVVKKPRQ